MVVFLVPHQFLLSGKQNVGKHFQFISDACTLTNTPFLELLLFNRQCCCEVALKEFGEKCDEMELYLNFDALQQ